MIDDKLTLSDTFRQWLKQTILSLQKETNELNKQKRRFTLANILSLFFK